MRREEKRKNEIAQLTAQGKIPHEAELEKHPERSLEGRMCEWSKYESLFDTKPL